MILYSFGDFGLFGIIRPGRYLSIYSAIIYIFIEMMYERKSYPDFKFHVNGVIYLSKSFVLWNRKFYQYDHSHP